MHTPVATVPRLRRCLRLALVIALSGALSSCILTTLTLTGYYQVAGVGDHEARVADAWRGPRGELALALAELEGAGGREDTVLVLTPGELEQMFAGQVPGGPPLLSVPHVRLPRTIMFRELTLPRPAPGDPARVPIAEWEPQRVESEGVERYAPPDSLVGEPLAVHWSHHYRTGMDGESGFVLLLTRSTPDGPRSALLMPERFRQPAWTNVMVLLAIAADVTWIALLLA